MAKALIDDMQLMTELMKHAHQLKADHSTRDDLFAKYEEMYLLDWKEKANEKLKHMQVTASPSFRNQVQGAVRLMIATDPQINIEPNEKTQGIPTAKIEQFLNSTLYQSGRLAGEPIHYPLITSGILWDEMHAAITSTADMLEYAREGRPDTERGKLYQKAAIARWEEIAETTSFLVEPWNPMYGYPEFGTTGLTAYYRIVQTTTGEVFDRFGQLPDTLKNTPRNTPVYLNTFYDQVYTAVWVDGKGGELFLKPHGLPRIPVVVQILNGSRLFADVEDQRQPFGYTLLKSNMWNAQNLALTAIYTAVLNQAWTPTKVYTPAADGSRLDVNPDEDVINLHPGDRLDFVQSKGLIDPSLREAYQLAENKGSESTIYPQALGAAVEGSATFSEVALMQQAGRLPLVGPQRRGGWGISSICETMLAMMRQESRYREGTGIQANEIPRGIEVRTKLEVSLPQDKLQQANIMNILTDPNNPKVSVAWALENVLNVNDPEKMRRDIWNERTTEAMYQQTVQRLLQAAQQAEQQAQAAAMQQQGGQPGPGQPGIPGQSPEPGAPPDQGQGGPTMPGMPMQGGLPQAQAGMVGGTGKMPMTPAQAKTIPNGGGTSGL